MKKILICGIKQSGSTRVFNLIQKLFQKQNINVDSCWEKNYKKKRYNKKCEVLIVKDHYYFLNNPIEFDYIILPLRDIRDCAISRTARTPNNIKNIKKDIDFMLESIDAFNGYYLKKTIYNGKQIIPYVIKYEDWGLDLLKQIQNYFNLDNSEKVLLQIMKELNDMLHSKTIVKTDNRRSKHYVKNKLYGIYQKTLLTREHNTSGGKSQKYLEYYTDEENKIITSNKIINNFLIEFEYI